MPSVSTTKMTADQYLQLGEDPPGVRLELVDAEIAIMSSPTPSHSYTEKMLSYVLAGHVVEHHLGELFGDVDTIIDPFNVRRPDLIYFAKDRLHLVGQKAMQGPPDLCVEIVSERSEAVDRGDKFERYRRFGVAHYWVCDQGKRTLEGYQLRGGKYVSTGRGGNDEMLALPPFAGLEVPLGKLWRSA